MIATRFNRFLREEAAELATGGGPAALPAAAAPAPAPALVVLPDPVAAEEAAAAPAAPVLAADPVREPSLLEKARAAFQSKASLLADANTAQAQLAEAQRLITGLQTEKAGLAAQVDALTGELATLRAERAEISNLLDTARATSAAAEDRAADIVAAVGFPAAALPAAEAEMEDDLDTVHARMLAATDPKEKAKLAREVRALRTRKN